MAGQKSLLPVELARRQMLDPRMAQFMPGMVSPNVLEMMAQQPPQPLDLMSILGPFLGNVGDKGREVIASMFPALAPETAFRQLGIAPEEMSMFSQQHPGMVNPKIAGAAAMKDQVMKGQELSMLMAQKQMFA